MCVCLYISPKIYKWVTKRRYLKIQTPKIHIHTKKKEVKKNIVEDKSLPAVKYILFRFLPSFFRYFVIDLVDTCMYVKKKIE